VLVQLQVSSGQENKNMLVAYEVSKSLIHKLAPIVAMIERRDRDLADQLRRAAASVVLNLGEGARSQKGNKPKHYAIAHGSAGEVRAALDVAQAWGWIDDSSPVLETLDRLLKLLWGLTHAKR
jgi:four helix bundle protein